MNRLILVAFALGALAACATDGQEAKANVTYQVVQADASIPFADNIRNFRVGGDRSLLLEGSNGRWYRATLSPPCQSSLPWEQKVAVKTDATSRFDRFSRVIVDGQVCSVRSLDEIADPEGTPAPQ